MFAINQRNFWRYWLGGLMLLAVLSVVAADLKVAEVAEGLAAHQTAGTAEAIDRIHDAWQAAGVIGNAKLVMAIDLIFVGVYSLGAFIGGMLFLRTGPKQLRKLGGLIAFAAVVFATTDYGETICQTIQLLNFKGSDSLAGIAAFLQPIKIIALIVTFIGLLVALFSQRFFMLSKN